jgi:hypothetical protein
MNWHQYPVFDGDSECFLPIAVNYAEGNGLANPIWHPIHVYDPEHPEKLTWHGFLYPVVLGCLSPKPTYKAIRMVIGEIWVLCLVFSGFAFFKCATMYGATSWRRDVLTITALLGMAGLMPDGGRPELLVALLLAIGILCALFMSFRWHWLISGVLLGSIIVTSPIPAILAMLGIGIYACARLDLKQAFHFLLRSGVVAALVFGICFVLYPYSLEAWLIGMSLHAKVAVTSGGGSGLLTKLHANPGLVFFIILSVTCFVAAISCYVKKTHEISSRFGVVCFAMLFLVATYYFSFRDLDRVYNAVALTPALVLFLVAYAASQLKKSKIKTTLQHLSCPICCVILVLASMPFLRLALVFPSFIKTGVSYDTAQNEFNSLSDKRGQIGITTAFFCLSEDFSKIHIENQNKNETFIFVQQVNRGRLTPPEIPGYEVMQNTFSTELPSFFGIKVGNTCGGYNFAVYQRVLKGRDK